VECGFAIRGCTDNQTTDTFVQYHESECHNIDHKAVLKHLVQGVLAVEVRMKPTGHFSVPLFIPKKTSACKTIQDLLMDETSADVVFVSGGGNIASNKKEIQGARLLPKCFMPIILS
jgi:hypothetical protein